jgi:hypothetical protein
MSCFAWPDPTAPDQSYRETAFGRSFYLWVNVRLALALTLRLRGTLR